MSRILEFRGYLDDPSGRRELLLWVEGPHQTPGEGDVYCEIGGSLFSRSMKIYGEDGQQAKTLAYSVIKKRLAGKALLDSAGTPVDSARLLKL